MQFTEKFLLTLIALGFFIFIPGFLHSFSLKSPNIKQTETPPLESSSIQVSTSNDFDPIYDDGSNSDSKYYDEEEARRDEIAEEIRRPWSQPLMISDDEFDMMENPFEVLGAYPRIGVKFFNTGDNIGPSYDMANYQLIHDENYCNMVDAYNLAHPENMFENRNIFTDFPDGKPRNEVLDKIGNVTMKGFNMSDAQRDALEYFHFYHEIGKNFLCATQMYNRIPGYESLTRKDLSLNSLRHYEDQLQNKPQCIPKNMFPQSYRLYNKEECQNFFDLIHSEEFLRTQDDLQYMLKVGYGPEKSNGITLLYQSDLADLDTLYDEDQKCGSLNKPFIVQKYVSQPLLLDKSNKFDLTVFMLIASTNPLIVYYHDGLLRASLTSYDTVSRDKNVHLTCTHLSKEIFQEAKGAFDDMTAQELRDYHLWTFEKLEEYLREAGVINDSKWLETFIRPALQKAFVHLVRMSKQGFLKQSNVYQLFQVDFLLDNDLNLWHVKTHPTPPFDLETKTSSKLIVSMLRDLFEIQYAYYQSRMKRLMEVMTEMQDRLQAGEDVDYEKQKAKYREASKNRLESEYEISKTNSWTLIVDENLPGVEAYFGYISEECV